MSREPGRVRTWDRARYRVENGLQGGASRWPQGTKWGLPEPGAAVHEPWGGAHTGQEREADPSTDPQTSWQTQRVDPSSTASCLPADLCSGQPTPKPTCHLCARPLLTPACAGSADDNMSSSSAGLWLLGGRAEPWVSGSPALQAELLRGAGIEFTPASLKTFAETGWSEWVPGGSRDWGDGVGLKTAVSAGEKRNIRKGPPFPAGPSSAQASSVSIPRTPGPRHTGSSFLWLHLRARPRCQQLAKAEQMVAVDLP